MVLAKWCGHGGGVVFLLLCTGAAYNGAIYQMFLKQRADG